MSDTATHEAEIAAKAASPVKKVVEAEPSKAGDDAKTENGVKSSPIKNGESEELKSAMMKFAAGKRHMLVQDPNAAVEAFAEASEALGKIYGETANECGESYFYYGKALLDLARMEAGVIDNVLDGEESEENSEEDEDDENGEEESEDKKEGDEAEAGPSTEDDDGAEAVKDNESIGSNEAGTSNAKDNTDEKAQEKEEEEDPSNLQLAWEMLELAKTIFTKHADSLETMDPIRLDLESKLSETYQTLGEVSIENENYPQAIEDLTMCLRRRQDLLPEDSRCIAETHYRLGVALGFNAQFDEAVNALSDAIGVLEKRISLLKESKESEDPSKKKDAFYTRDREIEEIQGIIPEIREKIADTKDMQEETIKKIGDKRLLEDAFAAAAAKAVEQEKPEASTENGGEAATSSKAAGNISHLVKKRKKSEEKTNGDSSPNKKPHLENGEAAKATNGTTSNGH